MKKLKKSLGKGWTVGRYNLADNVTARVIFELYYKISNQEFHVEIWVMFTMEPLQGYAVTTEIEQDPATLSADVGWCYKFKKQNKQTNKGNEPLKNNSLILP